VVRFFDGVAPLSTGARQSFLCKTPVTLRRACSCAGLRLENQKILEISRSKRSPVVRFFDGVTPSPQTHAKVFHVKPFSTTVTIFSPRRLLRTTCTLPEPLLIAHRFSSTPCRRQNMMVGRVSRARCSHAPWSGRAPVWLSTCALSAP